MKVLPYIMSQHTHTNHRLIMLNVNECPPFPHRPYYHLLTWFLASWWRVNLLPVNKQENRLCHVSLGLPHSSLICENIYSGQKFQAFPWDPDGLQASLVQTCNQTHALKGHRTPSKYHMLKGEQRSTCRTRHTGMVMVWVCLHLRAHLHFCTSSAHEPDQPAQLKTKENLGSDLVSITPSVLHK